MARAAVETGLPAVCFRGVSFAYEAGESVLRGADFDLGVGESVCVIGPNGGGKTTLLRLLLGLLKPTAGTISVLGRSPGQTAGEIGYIPQKLQLDRMFPVTVLDVVRMGLLKRGSLGFGGRGERAVAEAALEQVGLVSLIKRPFAALSGGQQQGVLLARALVGEPKMLVLDEPTTHVDRAATGRLQATLAELTGKLTILTVSHDLHFVAASVGRVLCVNRTVRVHPVAELESGLAQELFGLPVKVVKHDVEEATAHAHDDACCGHKDGEKDGEGGHV